MTDLRVPPMKKEEAKERRGERDYLGDEKSKVSGEVCRQYACMMEPSRWVLSLHELKTTKGEHDKCTFIFRS